MPPEPRPPRPHPRPLSLEKPKPLPANASDREFALWCANLAAQCAHNWNVAQSWFELLSAQIKEIRDRREEDVPAHVAPAREASIHDIEEVVERVVSGNLNSERVREITTETITRKGYDDLSEAQKERRQFYRAVLLAVITLAIGATVGRFLPH
jgi:hypothetical protein